MEVNYKGNAVYSKFTLQHLNYYVHKAYGSGAFQTIENYL